MSLRDEVAEMKIPCPIYVQQYGVWEEAVKITKAAALSIIDKHAAEKPDPITSRDELIQCICDAKHRICGHIPPLHEGDCNVCKLCLDAQIEIVKYAAKEKPKPSDERPAREELRAISPGTHDARVSRLSGLAIVEAIDALRSALLLTTKGHV